jgi:beta-N-acetylhexosaminidase
VTSREALARGVILAGVHEEANGADCDGFAGALLFSRNGDSVAQVRALCDALRASSRDLPPIIAIDQEGGRVARLRDGIVPMPSAMALGAAADLELAERAGEQVAFDLRRAGITLNLAPDLDLALDSRNTVIGTRSFGDDPQRVASVASAFARGMERGGLQTCYKHFPGHGATATDSHSDLPVLDIDEATLRARDLVPFAKVAPQAGAMMTAHVQLAALDEDGPATLSRRLMTGVLRGELGFTGALLTDCLEMGAVDARNDRNAAVDALRAGADLLLFSHSPDTARAAVNAILEAVESGVLDESRLAEAHGRVERLRLTSATPLPLDASAPHPEIGREIARRAVTLVRGVPELDPSMAAAISFGGGAETIAREAPAIVMHSLSLDPSDAEVAAAVEALARSGRRPLLLARRAHLHETQVAAIASIVQRYPDAAVVSLLEPFDLPLFGCAKHLFATYGDEPVSLAGLADVLFGTHLAGGVLPVTLSW